MTKKRPEFKPSEEAGLFQRTGPAEPGEQTDKVIPKGIALKESEWRQLEAIGVEMGTNPHALTVWAVRDFLRRYQDGELPLQEQKKTTLPGL